MNPVYAVAAIGAVITLFFIVIRIVKGGIAGLCFKTLSSLGFLATTMMALWHTNFHVFGFLVLAGQIMGLLGDVFLDQKMIHKDYDFPYTNMGFTVFGIGHLIFIAGIVLSAGIEQLNLIVSAIAALIITGFVLVTEKPTGLNYGRFKFPVTAYGLVIGFTTALPFSYLLTSEALPKNLLLFGCGMAAFLASDLVLSRIYFTEKGETPVLVGANYVFYYGAQYLISLSAFAVAL